MSRTLIIGVGGGTSSGKTTLVKEMIKALGSDEVAVIKHDWYYRDRSALPVEERELLNYDHPDALDTDLLVSHLNALLKGSPVNISVYDFITHTRRGVTRTIYPRQVIIVEGILILTHRALFELMDIRIYVDAEPDTRFIRRLQRDVAERGRTVESVIEQYMKTVKPMHLDFVEPSKQYADTIISGDRDNGIAVGMLITKLVGIIRNASKKENRETVPYASEKTGV